MSRASRTTSRAVIALIAILTLSSIALAANNNPLLVGGPNALPRRPVGAVPLAAPRGAHLTYYGGRVVTNLQVIQVLWGTGGAGSGTGQFLSQVHNTSTPSIATFYQQVLNSAYVDWLTEYNTDIIDAGGHEGTNQTIGRGEFSTQVAITPSDHSNPIDDNAIQTELVNQIMAGHVPMPTTDSAGNNNTYYAIFFPHGLVITQGGVKSCASNGFCAYHGTIVANSPIGEIYYGVHPDMQSGSGCETGCGSAATSFGDYTTVASHEMTETITDGEVGIANSNGPPLAWYDTNNGEIGDICVGQEGSILGGDGQTYDVQREFSNSAGGCIVTASTTATWHRDPDPLRDAHRNRKSHRNRDHQPHPDCNRHGDRDYHPNSDRDYQPHSNRDHHPHSNHNRDGDGNANGDRDNNPDTDRNRDPGTRTHHGVAAPSQAENHRQGPRGRLSGSRQHRNRPPDCNGDDERAES